MKFSPERMNVPTSWTTVFEGQAEFLRTIPPTLQTGSLLPELEYLVTLRVAFCRLFDISGS